MVKYSVVSALVGRDTLAPLRTSCQFVLSVDSAIPIGDMLSRFSFSPLFFQRGISRIFRRNEPRLLEQFVE